MKILALDSSGMTAAVAVAENEKIIASYSVNYKKTHSQTLLPMLEEVTKMISLDLASIDAIALAAGPGSFTGLRIGGATAKGLGLALDKPIIAVPTLEGLAWNGWGFDGVICPLLDARANRVYAGFYAYRDEDIKVEMNQKILGLDELIGLLNEKGEKVLLLGDGSEVYRKKLASGLTVPFVFQVPQMRAQSAAAVAVCALKYLREGKTCTADSFVPDYMSLSQAERERNARLKGAANESVSG